MVRGLAFLGHNPVFQGISSLASSIGFVISIILLILASRIRQGILRYANVRDFNSNRELFRDRLKGLRDLITENKVMDEKLLSDLEVEVRTYMAFSGIVTWKDNWKCFWLFRHLHKGTKTISKSKLCSQLAYFISRYNKNVEAFF